MPDSVWRNPLEGAMFTRLTDFEGAEEDAIISPDGNFVAFLSSRGGQNDVWVLQIASGQFLNLTQGKFDVLNTQIRVLGFNPDGSQITIMTTGTPGKSATGIVPTIGGTPRMFLEGGLDPQWSPDGRRLFILQLDSEQRCHVHCRFQRRQPASSF